MNLTNLKKAVQFVDQIMASKKNLKIMKVASTYYVYFFLLSCISFSNCGNKCISERFYCREEIKIDKEKNIRLVKIYYNGELLEEYFSSNTNEKDSLYTHYYNGYISYKQQLRNGKMHGFYIVFYPNGDTNYVQYYVNDTLHGYSYGFYRNQKLKYKCLYKNGECVEQNYFDSIK